MLNRFTEWWRDCFGGVSAQSQVLLFSPTLILLIIDFYKSFFSGPLEKSPYLIAVGLTAIVASSAFIQLDKPGSRKLVGDNPRFGTEFLTLALLSLELNCMLYVLLFLPNELLASTTRAVWGIIMSCS